jgi:nicotinate-nucleotide adenylyltransferase
MTRRKRIGVFGGTFDPMHNAHLEIARAALDAVDLDEVLFVVAARPPHKGDATVASAQERLAMVGAALEGEPRMRACDIELRRDGPSYTADTLRALEAEYPGAELYLIIGLDSLVDMPKWREPEEILARAKLLVAPRTGEHWRIPEGLEGKYAMLPFEKIDLSSTEVRERLDDDRDITELVPPTVAAHIQREGTYHDHADSRPRE